jgi:hypothetical protein
VKFTPNTITKHLSACLHIINKESHAAGYITDKKMLSSAS